VVNLETREISDMNDGRSPLSDGIGNSLGFLDLRRSQERKNHPPIPTLSVTLPSASSDRFNNLRQAVAQLSESGISRELYPPVAEQSFAGILSNNLLYSASVFIDRQTRLLGLKF
jgi:hypothetical protein